MKLHCMFTGHKFSRENRSRASEAGQVFRHWEDLECCNAKFSSLPSHVTTASVHEDKVNLGSWICSRKACMCFKNVA